MEGWVVHLEKKSIYQSSKDFAVMDNLAFYHSHLYFCIKRKTSYNPLEYSYNSTEAKLDLSFLFHYVVSDCHCQFHLSSLWYAFFISLHVQLLTKGCETSEMTLRRNGLGQLGFHVNYEGIVAEVTVCTLLRCLFLLIEHF